MDKLRKTLALLCVAAIAAAAAPFLTASPDLCFTAGSVTYRLSAARHRPTTASRSTTTRRIRTCASGWSTGSTTADFALTDDAGAMTGNACKAAGAIKTVRIVAAGTPSDLTIAVSRADPVRYRQADFALYVHSARVSHFDAAALFALVRHAPGRDRALAARPTTWPRSAKI